MEANVERHGCFMAVDADEWGLDGLSAYKDGCMIPRKDEDGYSSLYLEKNGREFFRLWK